MTNVIAWPPVNIVGAEWTEIAPVERSASLVTGREYLSATKRIRRLASLDVSAIGSDASGAGYMEMLKRLLAGEHAVRLHSMPINWHVAAPQNLTAWQSQRISWTESGEPLDWEALAWFSGAFFTASTSISGGWQVVEISGLPPSSRIATPGEFMTVFDDMADDVGHVVQVLAPAQSDESGNATVRVFETLPSITGGRVNLKSQATGVFRPVTYPRSVQPLGGDWTYSWEFREIFEDEVDEFVEVDPWS
ncbi:MAG: hypothetical protein VYD87_13280 [Pseudomonadota bacterium]|nr:hypothetical protein [Pseudomonadota bacterium]MEE3099890.1 hypothetical protein [Pseudomonadota bacterium]